MPNLMCERRKRCAKHPAGSMNATRPTRANRKTTVQKSQLGRNRNGIEMAKVPGGLGVEIAFKTIVQSGRMTAA